MNRDHDFPVKGIVLGSFIGFILLFILTMMLSGFEIVDPGYRGVYVAMGDVEARDYNSGFYWKAPWASIKEISVVESKMEQEVDAASRDLQQIHTTIAITYTPEDGAVHTLFQTIGADREGWENTLIRPRIEEITKSVTAHYNAEGLIKERLEMKNSIQERLTKELRLNKILVHSVSIVNFRFDSAYMEAVSRKQVAEQDALTAQNALEKAKIESQRQIAEAEARQKAMKFETDADAYKITARAEAEKQAQEKMAEVLKANPQLIKWRWLEKWNGVMPRVVGAGDTMFLIPDEQEK